MARIVRRITVERDLTEVFDAIADFSTTADWDPGLRASEALDDPAVGMGARYMVTLDQGGPIGPRLEYLTVLYERPRRVVLRTRNRFVEGTDDVTVTSEGNNATTVTWQADFAVRGPIGRLVDPLLARGFQRVGEKAVRGLEAWLRDGGSAHHSAAA